MITPGQRIREFRESMDMTQGQLAALYGRKKNWIKNRELGYIRINYEFLLVLYKKFNLSPNWVLFGIEPRILKD